MVRGYLAEAYDGIGQYVMVTLAKSSSSAAYKARVAAGDFGGRRTFPVGTPVHLTMYRGQPEVHLGNLPCRCDEFDREVAQFEGWGEGPLGPWLNAHDLIETYNETQVYDGEDYVTGGEGIFAYPQPEGIGQYNPVQGLKFPSGITIPVDIDIIWRVVNIPPGGVAGSGIFFVLYFGPFFHYDWNSWLTVDVGGGLPYEDWDLDWDVNSEGPYQWPDWTDFANQTYSVIGDPDILAPFHLKVRLESGGAFAKNWHTDVTEPSDWQAYVRWDPADAPDPSVMYRAVYLESQSFVNESGPGGEPLPLGIDQFCIRPCPREKSTYIPPP